MQSVVLHVLPIFGGKDVPKRIDEIVVHHLGHASRAGGEIEQHDVVIFGCQLTDRSNKVFGSLLHSPVKIKPSWPVFSDQCLDHKSGGF